MLVLWMSLATWILSSANLHLKHSWYAVEIIKVEVWFWVWDAVLSMQIIFDSNFSPLIIKQNFCVCKF